MTATHKMHFEILAETTLLADMQVSIIFVVDIIIEILNDTRKAIEHG